MQRRHHRAVFCRLALVCVAGAGIVALPGQASGLPVSQEPVKKDASPAETPPTKPAAPAAYVIVDLTVDPKSPDATQVVAFRAETVTGGPDVTCPEKSETPIPAGKYQITQLAKLIDCASDPTALLYRRLDAIKAIQQLTNASAKLGNPRFITDKADVVRVVVLDAAQAFCKKSGNAENQKCDWTASDASARREPIIVRGRKPSVTFKEEARELQFISDLRTLAGIAGGILAAPAALVAALTPEDLLPPMPVLWAHVSSHTLRLTRATVTVAAESGTQVSILAKPKEENDETVSALLANWEVLQAERATQSQRVQCDETTGVPSTNERLRNTPFAVLLCRAKAGPDPEERLSAIESLGTLGDARATPDLIELSKKTTVSAAVRNAALKALAKLKAPSAPTPAAAKADGEEPPKPSAQVITGPIEHWFLSADVPLNNVQALTFDKDTNQVSLGNEPSTFYIGINFLFGDLKDNKRTFLGNVVLSGMIKASQHPLDSVGVALGLRGQYLSKWGLNLDVLTPFVAMTFTQEDIEKNGAVTRRARRNSELRGGVSLNLDKAAKWVGGK